MATVLVVEDQTLIRRQLAAELTAMGLAVVEAGDGEEAWRSVRRNALDLVVTDLQMPRCNGIELVRRIRTRSDVPVIVVTGQGSIERAANAFKAGADEFIHGPDMEIDDLLALIARTARPREAGGRERELERRLPGVSRAMKQLRWQMAGLAALGTPVLLTGERGTGKRTAVRALHELGASATRPIETVEADRFAPPAPGVTPLLSRSPTHLVDLETLAPDAQAYFATRLLQAESRGFPAEARIFFTSRDPNAIRSQAFHAGLSRMLERFHLHLPALSERPEDVRPIVRALTRRIGRALGRNDVRIGEPAVEFLAGAEHQENVRSLEQTIERAIAFSPDPVLRRETFERLHASGRTSIAELRDDRRAREHERLVAALMETGGNITRVAEMLGRSRPTIYRMIERHRIPLERER